MTHEHRTWPYVGEDATTTNPTPGPGAPELETTFIASQVLCDIGNGVSARAEVFNGKIPGPMIRLQVGNTAVIRVINELTYPIGIHWHGVELENYSDGTEITQNAIPPAPLQILGKRRSPSCACERPGAAAADLRGS